MWVLSSFTPNPNALTRTRVRKPVNSQTLNYSIVAVGIVILYSFGFWILSARKWFTGPIRQIEGQHPLDSANKSDAED